MMKSMKSMNLRFFFLMKSMNLRTPCCKFLQSFDAFRVTSRTLVWSLCRLPDQRRDSQITWDSPRRSLLVSLCQALFWKRAFRLANYLRKQETPHYQAAAVCFSVHLSRTRKLRLHPCVKCFMARMIALFVSFRGCCLTTHRLRLLSPQSQMNGSSYVQHLLQRPLSRSCACRSL